MVADLIFAMGWLAFGLALTWSLRRQRRTQEQPLPQSQAAQGTELADVPDPMDPVLVDVAEQVPAGRAS